MLISKLSKETMQAYDRVKIVASTPLSALKVVTLNTTTTEAIYADRTVYAHMNNILGITTTAIGAHGNGYAVTNGEWSDAGWTWTMGDPIFLNTTGNLTQTTPASGFICIMGFPETATKMMVAIQPCFKL